MKRPQYFGVLTNDVVYKRLAPGVLEELKRVRYLNIADQQPKLQSVPRSRIREETALRAAN